MRAAENLGRSTTTPVAVADYTYDALPPSARDAVPTDTELTAGAAGVLTQLTVTNLTPPPDENGRS